MPHTYTWYHAAVDYVTYYGLMRGIGEEKFAPEAHITRAQLAQILYNMEGTPEYTESKNFSDVEETENGEQVWYYDGSYVGCF